MKAKSSTRKIVFLVALLLGSPLAAQTLQSVGLLPPTVTGGGASSGQIGLSSPAPAGGTTVTLSSSNPAVASVPASTLVLQGSTTRVFTIDTAAVQSTVQVTITAQLGSVARSAVLTVEPDYPPFFDSPPTTLLIGAFTLTVKSYQAKSWDFSHNQMIGATGTATAALTADGVIHALPVRFENLVVTPVVQGTGQVAGGTAFYPDPALPTGPEALALAGFTLRLDGLTLAPSSAIATGKLWTPPTIADGSGQCLPGQMDLGSFPITPQCVFYVSRPVEYGDFIIGNTGIRLNGTGFQADFSTTQSPVANPPLPASWRGVFLGYGQTVPSTHPVSNTGYLKAAYFFNPGIVTATGFSAKLTLLGHFDFESLDPEGFKVSLYEGYLDVVNNAVTGGQFTPQGQSWALITVSPKAASDASGNALFMSYNTLTVQPDLDLYGEVFDEGNDVFWGDLAGSPTPLRAYGVTIPSVAYFYLSAGLKPAFRPLDPNGLFKSPNISSPATDLESQNLQGVTMLLKDTVDVKLEFTIRTPDTPGQAEISGYGFLPTSWINVAGRGVHGDVRFRTVGSSGDNVVDLGPTGEAGYVGVDPFKTTWSAEEAREIFLAQFVDSAVYRSEAKGTVRLEGAVKKDLPFEHLQFTSTAQCPGAKVNFTGPLKLDYWRLDLVKKPGAGSVGPMSVKTGQIFLTAAGIQEPRHFEKPFWLTWGEILASGQFGRMVFDHNSSGQKFDGFNFVPEVIALSDYDDTDSTHQKAFLQAAGTAHFDFFGENYLDLRDFFSPIAGDPMNGRKIELGFDGLHGAKPTDDQLDRDWSGGFGAAAFKIGYDDGDQDGFVSIGNDRQVNHVAVIYLAGELFSSLNLSRHRACISVGEMEIRNVNLPAVADFAGMKRITGCACIEDGQLKRMNLTAEADNSLATILLRTANFMSAEINLTPATSELRLHGDMLISVVTGGADIQLDGQARFLVNRDEVFTEGDLIGKIEASAFVGIAHAGSLSAEGQLSWHFGKLGFGGAGYNSIQGRVVVGVVAPGASVGVGVEGGFYVGQNAPQDEAWVIKGMDPRFQFDLQLPERLTGVYGYAMVSASVNAYVISGGFETYAGLGAFSVDGFPAPFGHLRAYLWGDILGGLLSAAAWGDLQVVLSPVDPQFKGTVGVEVCALWVLCASADISMLVNSSGVHFN